MKTYAFEIFTPRGRMIVRQVGFSRIKPVVKDLLDQIFPQAEGTRGVCGEWDAKKEKIVRVTLSATREGNRVVTRHGW